MAYHNHSYPSYNVFKTQQRVLFAIYRALTIYHLRFLGYWNTLKNVLKTLGDSAFCGAAPILWHILPNNIRNSRTYDIFKVLSKTHLFKEVFL